MRNIVYFDLETQKSFQQVGGSHNRAHELLVSIGVTWNTADGEYRIFTEDEIGGLVTQLQRADLVVGYNIVGFDYRVLTHYTPLDLESVAPTLDLMADLEKRVGFRPKLDSVAQATLGVGKTGDGLDALKWFQEGRLDLIAEYCCYDVKVTRLVHEFGAAHRKVYYLDRSGTKRLETPVEWPGGKSS